jgi:signal transduction histidine kinase
MFLDYLRSSTFRLAISYMVLFVGSALLLLGFFYWSTVAFMARQTEDAINAEIGWLYNLYLEKGMPSLLETVKERARVSGQDGSVYAVLQPNGRVVAGNLQGMPSPADDADGVMSFHYRDVMDNGRQMQIRGHVRLLDSGQYLFVGRDISENIALQHVNDRALVWGLLVMTVLGLLGGVIMSRRVLRHIERINRTTREIMAGDMSRRIPTRGTSDDFDQLAVNLNAMLDQIAKLMDGIRHVSNSVAHDLRTPLTRLRNQLEALSHSLGEDSPQAEQLEKSIADADHLLSTFSGLLRIARIEAGGHKTDLGIVDLAALMRDACELYDAVAEAKHISMVLDADNPASILGDRDMIFQAISNLIDNAIKYAPENGHIGLGVYPDVDNIVVRIADNGPGIPQSDYDRVVQRFYRGDQSRSTTGSGLGLSLVDAVANMHGASLEFTDNNPGLVVSLSFRAGIFPQADG